MKKFRIIATILFFAMLLLGTSSCAVHQKSNNGKHLGWYKTPSKHHLGKGKTWKSNSKKSYNSYSVKSGKGKSKGRHK